MTTESEPEPQRRILPFIVYVILFFSVWVAWVLAIYPALTSLGERSLYYAISNNILRLLIWVVPVFLFLKYIDRVDPIEYLKLRSNWRRGVVVGLVFTILNFVLGAIADGIPAFDWKVVTWNSIIGTSLLIGFVEEIPFRGFVLQKLQERMGFWPAAFVSSILFLLIHFPGWIALHLLNTRTAITVFVIGFIMAVLFWYTKSLWSSIIAHSGNDLISFVIFHR